MELDIRRLPIAGLVREITLVARALGELPQLLAARAARALSAAFERQLPRLPEGSYRITASGVGPAPG
jgi:hypothetical protein